MSGHTGPPDGGKVHRAPGDTSATHIPKDFRRDDDGPDEFGSSWMGRDVANARGGGSSGPDAEDTGSLHRYHQTLEQIATRSRGEDPRVGGTGHHVTARSMEGSTLDRAVQAPIFRVMRTELNPRGEFSRINIPTAIPREIFVSSLPRNTNAFWEMIDHYDIDVGVQLERGNYTLSPGRKLTRSPTEEVQCISRESIGGLHHSQYLLHKRLADGSNTEKIYHHLEIDWPDFGVPSKPVFHQLVRMCQGLCADKGADAHMYVHCMGGHGRSGTFVLAYTLMQQPEHTNPAHFLRDMRLQRAGLVEKNVQMDFAVENASELSGKHFGDWKIDHLLIPMPRDSAPRVSHGSSMTGYAESYAPRAASRYVPPTYAPHVEIDRPPISHERVLPREMPDSTLDRDTRVVPYQGVVTNIFDDDPSDVKSVHSSMRTGSISDREVDDSDEVISTPSPIVEPQEPIHHALRAVQEADLHPRHVHEHHGVISGFFRWVMKHIE